MKTQDKQLLLKDLCARLPHDVKIQIEKVGEWDGETKYFIVSKELTFDDVKSFAENGAVLSIKPYLRPMSSMTKKEEKEYSKYAHFGNTLGNWIKSIDYLNSIHVDYRGLIPMGLALPAPNGMYNF